jgi:head-tail adaptor
LQLSDLGQVGTSAVTDDSGGGGTTVWSFGADVPCRIDPLGNDESVAASRLSDRSTNVVTVPAGTVVSATNRFAITGRGTFEITGVDDRTGERARFFEVVAVS